MPDYRGHGGSDPGGPYGLDRFVEDALAAFDHRGVERAHDGTLAVAGEGLDLVPPDSRVELRELRPRLHGDFALVTGHYEVSALLADGKDVTSSTRFTSAWAWRDGRWQALAHQATNANWKARDGRSSS